jgi:hypothetical protein
MVVSIPTADRELWENRPVHSYHKENILVLYDRLLRPEKFLLASRVFFGTARLHFLPFTKNSINILRLAVSGSSGTNFSMNRIVLRSFPSLKICR